ncbi:hypothetical protein D0962_34410 [Leptolyngbyaceae cyanobacterium CCMR0082]|uniref:Uncharacterized protein n=1 Tax=Adonisia turfae CCMR0082 TaxID=2304604 RepID=A0A6M0SIH7_9CYAN|nr:hypothetical protein [Adonisia turfae]NEZ67793.1 hypothetical protein [Adonisia turfae CCMR0082]
MSDLARQTTEVGPIEIVNDLDKPMLGAIVKEEVFLTGIYAAAAIASVFYLPLGAVTALGIAIFGYNDIKATMGTAQGGSGSKSQQQSDDNNAVKDLPSSRQSRTEPQSEGTPQAIVRDDWEAVFSRIVDQAEFPSLFIYGRQGTGKTTLVNYLLMLINNEKVVLDPHYKYGAHRQEFCRMYTLRL